MNAVSEHEVLGLLYLLVAHASKAVGLDIVPIAFAVLSIYHFLVALVHFWREMR